jgi:hypothetical protein
VGASARLRRCARCCLCARLRVRSLRNRQRAPCSHARMKVGGARRSTRAGTPSVAGRSSSRSSSRSRYALPPPSVDLFCFRSHRRRSTRARSSRYPRARTSSGRLRCTQRSRYGTPRRRLCLPPSTLSWRSSAFSAGCSTSAARTCRCGEARREAARCITSVQTKVPAKMACIARMSECMLFYHCESCTRFVPRYYHRNLLARLPFWRVCRTHQP